jgi:hypothetical protein
VNGEQVYLWSSIASRSAFGMRCAFPPEIKATRTRAVTKRSSSRLHSCSKGVRREFRRQERLSHCDSHYCGSENVLHRGAFLSKRQNSWAWLLQSEAPAPCRVNAACTLPGINSGQPDKVSRSVGAQGRDRTTDTAIFSRMLYQLSYLGILGRKAVRAGGL